MDRQATRKLASKVANAVEEAIEDADLSEQLTPEFVDESARPLWELSAAIRRGDTAEAELQLDRIARDLGQEAEEQVQQGRYSQRARRMA